MMPSRVNTDAERPRDLSVCCAVDEEPCDLTLAPREPVGIGAGFFDRSNAKF